MPTLPNPFSNNQTDDCELNDESRFRLNEDKFMRDIAPRPPEPNTNPNWLDALFEIADDLPSGLPLFLANAPEPLPINPRQRKRV